MNNINDFTLDFFDTLHRNQRMIAEIWNSPIEQQEVIPALTKLICTKPGHQKVVYKG